MMSWWQDMREVKLSLRINHIRNRGVGFSTSLSNPTSLNSSLQSNLYISLGTDSPLCSENILRGCVLCGPFVPRLCWNIYGPFPVMNDRILQNLPQQSVCRGIPRVARPQVGQKRQTFRRCSCAGFCRRLALQSIHHILFGRGPGWHPHPPPARHRASTHLARILANVYSATALVGAHDGVVRLNDFEIRITSTSVFP